jgi:hypothetical protein
VRRCTSLLVLASMWRPEIHVTRKWFKEVGPTSWRVSSDWFKGSKSRGNEVFVALNMGVSCKCSHKPIQWWLIFREIWWNLCYCYLKKSMDSIV